MENPKTGHIIEQNRTGIWTSFKRLLHPLRLDAVIMGQNGADCLCRPLIRGEHHRYRIVLPIHPDNTPEILCRILEHSADDL